MKLKTLKDIEFFKHDKFWEEKLKRKVIKEAIKWVKKHHIVPFGSFCEFFNITSEDLK